MFTKSIVFGALVLAASASQAQVSVLAVSGTIAVPACTLVLSGGGVAGYGAITAHDIQLSPITDDYATPRYLYGTNKPITLTVLCPTASKVALSFVDNRASSAKPAVSVDPSRFGLGTYTQPGGSVANIGNYYLYTPTVNVKATAAAVAAPAAIQLVTAGVAASTSTWHKALPREAGLMVPGSTGYGTTATSSTPDSLVSIVADMTVKVELLTETVNSATTAINLDGSATVTLVTL